MRQERNEEKVNLEESNDSNCEEKENKQEAQEIKKTNDEKKTNEKHFYDNDAAKSFSLTDDYVNMASKIISSNQNSVSDFWKAKYENESAKNWDKFYQRNSTNFFKDRHWLHKEFPELLKNKNVDFKNEYASYSELDLESSSSLNFQANITNKKINCSNHFQNSKQNILQKNKTYTKHLVEIGCGVGNALIPILINNDEICATAIDCSQRAIDFLNTRWQEILKNKGKAESVFLDESEDADYREESNSTNNFERKEDDNLFSTFTYSFNLDESEQNYKKLQIYENGERLRSSVWDITQKGDVPPEICEKNSADFVILLFVLSAIHKKYHEAVINKCAKLLKEGGMLILRDYGLFDMAQIRFAKQAKSKIDNNLYVRYDGTYAYYFSSEELRHLHKQSGLKEVENKYVLREISNRKTGVKMKRVWIQTKYIKMQKEKFYALTID